MRPKRVFRPIAAHKDGEQSSVHTISNHDAKFVVSGGRDLGFPMALPGVGLDELDGVDQLRHEIESLVSRGEEQFLCRGRQGNSVLYFSSRLGRG